MTPVPPAPVRMAHVGLGAFHRAHQAWYTQHAGDSGEWGIAGFTGRSPAVARALAAQGCRYTLIERGPERDRGETIAAIVAAHDGADERAWHEVFCDPDVGVVTVTVTEAGYAADSSAPGRIAAALAARAASGAGAIALVGCDNLSGNGGVLRDAVLVHADADLRGWLDENASFVDTMVDRITPATTDADRATARELTGRDDAVPVVAEPFAEWVLAGSFPAGRPRWEDAGARFVDDVAPYEERKLWLLNAGHSLLAYAGRLRGFATVSDAFADADLRDLLERLWAEQRVVVDLPPEDVDVALEALRTRFANGRIRHNLEQIGRDGALKLPLRILAPMTRRVARGLPPGDAERAVLEAWAGCLDCFGATDAASAAVVAEVGAGDQASRVDRILETLDREGARR